MGVLIVDNNCNVRLYILSHFEKNPEVFSVVYLSGYKLIMTIIQNQRWVRGIKYYLLILCFVLLCEIGEEVNHL